MNAAYKVYDKGDTIDDRYDVRERCRGGMGYVYIVFDRVEEKSYAIKTIKETLFEDEDFLRRFTREAENWIRLEAEGPHEHIVSAIEFRSERTPPLLFLEYIDGIGLDRLLRNEPQGLAISEAVRFATHIARGLAHAHSHGRGEKRCVVHRDLKPSNIMISKQRVAKITDFGLSRAQGDNELSSSYQRRLGTPQYMPPEQYDTFHWVTEKADIFSFGALLYELITGVFAFQGKDRSELERKIKERDPLPLRQFRPDADEALVSLVDWCLKKHPVDRPTSAELLNKLQEIRDRGTSLVAVRAACKGCGYTPNRDHQKCPICGTEPEPEIHADPWLCRCNREVPADYRFCMHCGLDRETPVTCPKCRQTNRAEYRFCCHCGARLPDTVAASGD